MVNDPRNPFASRDGERGDDFSLADLTNPFLWPWFAVKAPGQVMSTLLAGPGPIHPPEPAEGLAAWATPHQVRLELPTMRLRDFSRRSGERTTLICGPFALHGANVVDFAPGFSLVEALQECGLARICVTDWRSATPGMRYFSIDTYLADLNVAVDEVGPVDLVGVCQGGWLALLYAARFPHKVGRLVIAGAPVDVCAAESAMTRLVNGLPNDAFEHLVRRGEGLVRGRHIRDLWTSSVASTEAAEVLQLASDVDAGTVRGLARRFAAWDAVTVDLPGTYYLQVVEWLYRENRIVRNCFPALGRLADLASVSHPLFLLAGRDDRIVAPEQLLALARHVPSRPNIVVAPCGHLSLFMGRLTLREIWPQIGHWLGEGHTPPPSLHPNAAPEEAVDGEGPHS
jgi:poly(3-hydroxyalkanoate) synthetase